MFAACGAAYLDIPLAEISYNSAVYNESYTHKILRGPLIMAHRHQCGWSRWSIERLAGYRAVRCWLVRRHGDGMSLAGACQGSQSVTVTLTVRSTVSRQRLFPLRSLQHHNSQRTPNIDCSNDCDQPMTGLAGCIIFEPCKCILRLWDSLPLNSSSIAHLLAPLENISRPVFTVVLEHGAY